MPTYPVFKICSNCGKEYKVTMERYQMTTCSRGCKGTLNGAITPPKRKPMANATMRENKRIENGTVEARRAFKREGGTNWTRELGWKRQP